MSKVDLKGLGVALITPFKEDYSIDYDALSRLVQFHLESGTDYIVALGTTAETPTLSKQEKNEVVRFIVEQVNGKIPVVMGLGSNNTAELVYDLKNTGFSGVSALLSVTPYYNKPTQEGLYQHYCALSQASPLPVILYNVPGRTGVNMNAETTLRLARECDNIVAVKEASGDLAQIKTIIDKSPEGFHVISGDDAITTDVIALGGIGVISVFANAFPVEMVWLVKNALQGNIADARRKMNADFETLFHLMFVEGNPAGVKCLLYLKRMIQNKLRLPLVPVSEKTLQEIKGELAKFS
ncbi:4-hydroxy-tetrahydrodipicolinate synthase [Proteiniphilum sp.]|uniref:4-hydroxy-tetrahydrodipicolinate synthase n=1 Tax=Proteiniphilum sp. TaxID=1926877 RepID=UPI002B215849|nr:4-hydroxy-tetrahydrodipicolinate synthase [Proteiniphilum sp.]MEA4916216.1 4-hydroxy-tetrahydrodipicolinate synthase [Proteiniphilum sp.]